MNGIGRGTAAAATAASGEPASNRTSAPPGAVGEPPTGTLRFITWNIDGLDESNLLTRTEAVCRKIKAEHVDIVFLQELVPETAYCLLVQLPEYLSIFAGEDGYFVGTLLKKSTVAYESSHTTEFENTRMGRNVLQVDVSYEGVPLRLLNSHLESTSRRSEERVEQLLKVLREMSSAPRNRMVIFGGDLNLRDKEVAKIGGLPEGIDDLWVVCGSRDGCAYTFDLTKNDNKVIDKGYKPRLRFDRVYVRHASPARLKPTFFNLIGTERIGQYGCFPSDHFGILCHFALV